MIDNRSKLGGAGCIYIHVGFACYHHGKFGKLAGQITCTFKDCASYCKHLVCLYLVAPTTLGRPSIHPSISLIVFPVKGCERVLTSNLSRVHHGQVTTLLQGCYIETENCGLWTSRHCFCFCHCVDRNMCCAHLHSLTSHGQQVNEGKQISGLYIYHHYHDTKT